MGRLIPSSHLLQATIPWVWEMVEKPHHFMEGLPLWSISLISLMMITLILASMTLKQVAKKGRRGGGNGGGEGSSKRSKKPIEEEEEEEEDDDDTRRTIWRESLYNRGVICERQVKGNFDNPIHESLTAQGLLAGFQREIPGYSLPLVAEFYSNMSLGRKNGKEVLYSFVEGVEIEVDRKAIARHLLYPAGDNVDSPFMRRPMFNPFSEDLLVEKLSSEHGAYDGVRRTFKNGKMRIDFQYLLKIVHHNIYPRGSDKLVPIEEAALLYAVKEVAYEIDFAKFILLEMVEFIEEQSKHANLPYPAMVTALVMKALKKKNVRLTKGTPGVINHITYNKILGASKHEMPYVADDPEGVVPPGGEPSSSRPSSSRPSSSRSRPVDYPPDFEPEGKTFNEKVLGWLKAIFCQVDDVKRSQKRLERRQKKMREEQRAAREELDYIAQWAEASTGVPYVPEERQPEEESDDDD